MQNNGILTPGYSLTLRPMKYPLLYQRFVESQANNWSVQEISFGTDVGDLRDKLTPAEKHAVHRLVAFFATGDSIVGNNLCLVLYRHLNAPEVRLYYSRQIFEEALHVQFYLTLLDNYLPDMAEREGAFSAINNIPSIRNKADFCFKWMNQIDADRLDTDEHKRQFLLNLITFAAAVEGLFFFAAFAYVYYLRSKGLLHGFAAGTNWVFRDESMHMNTAFEVVDIIRGEYPHLWDGKMEEDIKAMMADAIRCETQFAHDMLNMGIAGLSVADMEQFLRFSADQRFKRLDIPPVYNAKNPFPFMDLQDMQSLTMFFERTVSEYAVGAISGDVRFDENF